MARDSGDPNVPALPVSAGRKSGEDPAWHILDSTVPEEGGLLARGICIHGSITYHIKAHGRGSL